jgi:hypothetical protein
MMDINYILGREQISLHNASVATSSPARIAHLGLAAAYGALLTSSIFPHRLFLTYGVKSRAKTTGSRSIVEDAVQGSPTTVSASAGATRGHVVLTPDDDLPYKVVLEHEQGENTEQPVSTIREGGALITKTIPTPLEPNTSWDHPVSVRS